MARPVLRSTIAAALVALSTGCTTWNNMDRTEKGTAVGATGGAVVGAAVGGPVGAAIGAGVGGYAGHHQAKPDRAAQGARGGDDTARTDIARAGHDDGTVRSVQQSLSARGYDVGPVDGVWGPSTESALRQFQQSQGLPQTGDLDPRTLAALGVAR